MFKPEPNFSRWFQNGNKITPDWNAALRTIHVWHVYIYHWHLNHRKKDKKDTFNSNEWSRLSLCCHTIYYNALTCIQRYIAYDSSVDASSMINENGIMNCSETMLKVIAMPKLQNLLIKSAKLQQEMLTGTHRNLFLSTSLRFFYTRQLSPMGKWQMSWSKQKSVSFDIIDLFYIVWPNKASSQYVF